MQNAAFFLSRCIKSIEAQTFKDYEIVIASDGKWAENHNSLIKKSKGDLIKFMHMDDYFYHPDALQRIVDNFTGDWLVTGCIHDDGERLFNPHYPSYRTDIYLGHNTIGAPTVVTIKNDSPLLFDESMTWLVDCDYYHRMYTKYGEPTILNTLSVAIGIHKGQATNLIPDEVKLAEFNYMQHKHG